jgi:hypothetical protein
MPIRDVLVRDPGSDVEHDDTALTCFKNAQKPKLEHPTVFLSPPTHNVTLRQRSLKTTEELTLDVITVPQTTKLLLSGSVPRREHDRTKVGVKLDRVDFDTEGGWMTASKGKKQPPEKKRTTTIKKRKKERRQFGTGNRFPCFVRSEPPRRNQ